METPSLAEDAAEMHKTTPPGYVEYLGKCGSDAFVTTAARVSFGGDAKDSLDPKDERLIAYLAKHKHFSPFRHLQLQVRIRAPKAIMMQIYKHVVGIAVTAPDHTVDHAWSEVSQRYRAVGHFYVPDASGFRKQHQTSKQASDGPLDAENAATAQSVYEEAIDMAWHHYQRLLDLGVAKEQARFVLPQATFTEVVWTASLQAVWNFVSLRKASDAQGEIQYIARQLETIAMREFPISWNALQNQEDKSQIDEDLDQPVNYSLVHNSGGLVVLVSYEPCTHGGKGKCRFSPTYSRRLKTTFCSSKYDGILVKHIERVDNGYMATLGGRRKGKDKVLLTYDNAYKSNGSRCKDFDIDKFVSRMRTYMPLNASR